MLTSGANADTMTPMLVVLFSGKHLVVEIEAATNHLVWHHHHFVVIEAAEQQQPARPPQHVQA
jgi:hypothetical protein